MKKILPIGIGFIVLLLTLTACGISQEEYDAVVAERDAAKAEVISMQDKLVSAQSELAELENEQTRIQDDLIQAKAELSELENDLTATEDELSAKQQQISSLEGSLAETTERVTVLEEKIAREEGSEVGDLAPGFDLKNLNGTMVSLYDYWGSPVLLNFWATWCGPCRYEMPFLQQIYTEWQDNGLVIITINLKESSDKVQQFMKEYELTFPVVLDTSGEVSREYFVTAIPTTFFIDEYGVIQAKKIGSFSSKQQMEDYVKALMQ